MSDRPTPSDSALVLGSLFVAIVAVSVGLLADPKTAMQVTADWNNNLLAGAAAGGATSPAAAQPQDCMKPIKNSSGVGGAQDYQCVPGCNYTVQIIDGPSAQITPYSKTSNGNSPGQVYYKTPVLNTFGFHAQPAWQGPFTCNSTLSATMKAGVPNYFAGAYNYSFSDSGTVVQSVAPAASAPNNLVMDSNKYQTFSQGWATPGLTTDTGPAANPTPVSVPGASTNDSGGGALPLPPVPPAEVSPTAASAPLEVHIPAGDYLGTFDQPPPTFSDASQIISQSAPSQGAAQSGPPSQVSPPSVVILPKDSVSPVPEVQIPNTNFYASPPSTGANSISNSTNLSSGNSSSLNLLSDYQTTQLLCAVFPTRARGCSVQ